LRPGTTPAVFDQVYGRLAPHLLPTSFALGVVDTIDIDHDPAGEALAAGPFTGIAAGQRQRYAWRAEYTPREWADLVATHSDHLLLDNATREELLEEVAVALEALGPRFEVSFRTDLLSAIRR
jgi:hypothetical protein